MSVVLVGKAPFERALGYEKMFDENGREMHGSWGNMIEAEDAFAKMGADVMRWQYCQQPPTQDLWFGYGPGREIKRKLLTLWNSAKFLIDYGNIERFTPSWATLEPAGDLRPLDRWLAERTKQLVVEATDAYEATLTVDVVRAFEDFVDDVSNWYIRLSRRRFYSYDEPAFRTLWYALVQSLRVISPVMPFLTEHLWRNLVPDGPSSVHLAGWPELEEPNVELLRDIANVRRIVDLGRQARSQSGLKGRQPLRRLVVEGASLSPEHTAQVRDELRVKEVELGPVDATELRVKPNLPVLGPKLGKELGPVRAALEAGEFDELDDGGFRVGELELAPDEVLVERTGKEGWAVASADGVTVALDTGLNPELELEALVLDLIHQINAMRKEQGLELTDRIRITLPAAQRELLRHEEWIKRETLAVEIEIDGASAEPRIAKA
jgi:isoleucyl-tRNA synthetase